VDVRLGLEADYWPGLEAFLQEQLQSVPLNHVLGSVHPHIGDYRERFWAGDERAYQRTYFEHLAMAAESGLFDTLAHPDLIKNFTIPAWDVAALWPDIERALDRIAATGTAMELNTSGLHKAIPEMNPGFEILGAMRAREIPVVLGADAHDPQRVAANYEDALDVLERAGYHEINFFLERRRRTVPIAEARASLR
jgi:histidinol-phosphatase (PHP family)